MACIRSGLDISSSYIGIRLYRMLQSIYHNYLQSPPPVRPSQRDCSDWVLYRIVLFIDSYQTNIVANDIKCQALCVQSSKVVAVVQNNKLSHSFLIKIMNTNDNWNFFLWIYFRLPESVHSDLSYSVVRTSDQKYGYIVMVKTNWKNTEDHCILGS